MGILLPAALSLLGLSVPVLLLYMLRLRRRDLVVSSSLLWSRAGQEHLANMPWRRLRTSLLLFVQLLLLVLLVFSLSRPFFWTNSYASGNIVVVLDASASMQSTDVGMQSRFEQAKSRIASLIDGLSGREQLALLLAGPAPTLLLTSSDKQSLHNTLGKLQPTNASADISQAITLAAATARQLGDATVVLVSDGALSGQPALPPLPVKALYINVGKSPANLAITSMSIRDSTSGPELFASVLNAGSAPASAQFTVHVDNKLQDARIISLPPGRNTPVTFDTLPLSTHVVEADMVSSSNNDFLNIDNHAWLVRSQVANRRVLLVTSGNSFLEKALHTLPGLTLVKADPSGYLPNASSGQALTVFDSFLPPVLPRSNLLLISPPNSALLPVSGTITYPSISQTAAADPLMSYVDLSSTHIASARQITTPVWARVLATSDTGAPLILAGETEGMRVAVLAFDLHQSDLPLQVAFPILVSNFINYLLPSDSIETPVSLTPGSPLSLRPPAGTDHVVVTSPAPASRSSTFPSSSQVTYADTSDTGVYTVQYLTGGKLTGNPELFAVNLFSQEESMIAPNPDLAFIGAQPTSAQSNSAQHPQEIWPWVVGASLLLLTFEWYLYTRPGAWPRRLPCKRGDMKKTSAGRDRGI
ncbi:MAG: VWA domain-containing protein [Chloroflexota bacterium]|nr:VWA domain-containing protein [Chloroflexota bacterium]